MTDGERLVAWFRANARPLPWRTAVRDPYRSLLSELMAQQTRLDRVVPRFEAFVRRFPDLQALAAASEDEVLEAWSGLGYYRRARLLHRLSRTVADGTGELPRTAVELEKLPGIGRYTAAALASMVFGEAVPLMDGNVARVGARVLALDLDPRSERGRARVLAWVSELMRGTSPGEVNEALMELGARVCTPAGPRCDRCPLARGCRALADGNAEGYPSPKRTRVTVELQWIVAIAQAPDARWLLRRVGEGPILRGLWLPPFAELDGTRPAEERALELFPFEVVDRVELSQPVKHSITHRRISATPAAVRVEKARRLSGGWIWADPKAPGLPTSSLLGKLYRSVRE